MSKINDIDNPKIRILISLRKVLFLKNYIWLTLFYCTIAHPFSHMTMIFKIEHIHKSRHIFRGN